MKTAIIILAILTVVFWIAFKLLYAATLASPMEIMKIMYGGGGSGTAFFSGLCRILCWLCGAATIILLLILLI